MSDSPKFINFGGLIPKGINSGTKFFIPASFKDAYDTKNPVYLGSGTFGTVFGLTSLTAGSHVAVKKFIAPFGDKTKAQFCLRELQLLGGLKHENIVEMKFAYTPDDSLDKFSDIYLVTVYAGSNLFALLEQEKEENKQKFNLTSFQRMIYDLLKAIKLLNSANVIHRDLKPDNLAINKAGKLTLLDFGYARVKKDQMTNEPGQQFYRSFDAISFVIDGKPEYDEKTDIWSIAAILYEMLTGQILFYEENRGVRVYKIMEVCGPILDENVLEKYNGETREKLREKSLEYEGMNFLQQLENNSKSWLKEEIVEYKDAAADFIDRALYYNTKTRLSVDEALAHPFLAQVRDLATELTTNQSIVDYGDLALEESKRLIWNIVRKPDSFPSPSPPDNASIPTPNNAPESGTSRSLRPRKNTQNSAPEKSRKRIEPCKS